MSQVLFTVAYLQCDYCYIHKRRETHAQTHLPALHISTAQFLKRLPIPSPPPAVISLWIVAPRCFVGLTKGWTGYTHTAQAEVNKEREQTDDGYITPRCYCSVLPDLAPCEDNIALWKLDWHSHLQSAKSENTSFSLRFSFSHPNLSFSKMPSRVDDHSC